MYMHKHQKATCIDTKIKKNIAQQENDTTA